MIFNAELIHLPNSRQGIITQFKEYLSKFLGKVIVSNLTNLFYDLLIRKFATTLKNFVRTLVL